MLSRATYVPRVRLELGSTRLPHSQQHVNFPALLLSGVRKKANKKMKQGKGAPRKNWVREPFVWKQSVRYADGKIMQRRVPCEAAHLEGKAQQQGPGSSSSSSSSSKLPEGAKIIETWRCFVNGRLSKRSAADQPSALDWEEFDQWAAAEDEADAERQQQQQ